jgi:hypothetical protein
MKRTRKETELELQDDLCCINREVEDIQAELRKLQHQYDKKLAKKAKIIDRLNNNDYLPENTPLAEKWPYMDRLARMLALGGNLEGEVMSEDERNELALWYAYRDSDNSYPLSQMVARYSAYTYRFTEVMYDSNYTWKSYRLKGMASYWLHSSGSNYDPVGEVIISAGGPQYFELANK